MKAAPTKGKPAGPVEQAQFVYKVVFQTPGWISLLCVKPGGKFFGLGGHLNVQRNQKTIEDIASATSMVQEKLWL